MHQIPSSTIERFSSLGNPNLFLESIQEYFKDTTSKTDRSTSVLYHVLAMANLESTEDIIPVLLDSTQSDKNGIQLKEQLFEELMCCLLNSNETSENNLSSLKYVFRTEFKYQIESTVEIANFELIYTWGLWAINNKKYDLAVKLYDYFYSICNLNGITDDNQWVRNSTDLYRDKFKKFTTAIVLIYLLGRPGVPKNPTKAAQIAESSGYKIPFYEKYDTYKPNQQNSALLDAELYFDLAQYFSIHGAFTEAERSPLVADYRFDYDPDAVEISVQYPLYFFIYAYLGGCRKIPKGFGRVRYMSYHLDCQEKDEKKKRSNEYRKFEEMRSWGFTIFYNEIRNGNLEAEFEELVERSLNLRYKELTTEMYSTDYTKHWDRSPFFRCFEGGNPDAFYLYGLMERYLGDMYASYNRMSQAAEAGSKKAKEELQKYRKTLFGYSFTGKDDIKERFKTFYKDVKPNR